MIYLRISFNDYRFNPVKIRSLCFEDKYPQRFRINFYVDSIKDFLNRKKYYRDRKKSSSSRHNRKTLSRLRRERV